MSADDGAVETSTIYQREIIATDTRGVFASTKTILGTAYVGKGLLLLNGRKRDRRNDTSIHRESKDGRWEG
jgi:hypothetical protein